MKYGRYGWSHLFLSWGLGIVFLWIGVDILVHPDSWIGFIPDPVPFGLEKQMALQLNGVLDAVIGALLILRWWQKLVAAVAALQLLSIIALNGLDAVLIRDVGLLGAALAIMFWPTKYHKKRWWKVWQRGSSSSGDEE